MSLRVLPPAWSLQAFERELASLELRGLTGLAARWADDALVVDDVVPGSTVRKVRKRVALARAVQTSRGERPTVQFQLEQAADGGTRKVTSHALHALHAYKGKFYPQLARAAINAAGVPTNGRVLDPFAGCGTTVLEAALLGLRGYGVDANPLAVLVSQAKLIMLARDSDELADQLGILRSPPKEPAPVSDAEYLSDWLPKQNYVHLGRLIAGIHTIDDPGTRAIAIVIVSSVLREASLQDPLQLRVGRRRRDAEIEELGTLVNRALEDALASLSATRSITEINWDNMDRANRRVWFGDARSLGSSLGRSSGAQFDAVVTSPPYANALPYIDTDRLSLRAFGMLNGSQRDAERRLVGNREIGTSESRHLNQRVDEILSKPNSIPRQLRDVLAEARRAAEDPSAGFRRQRTPGLLWAYFRDMTAVLGQIADLLKHRAPAVLVVGDSSFTGWDGDLVEVPTTDILIELAAARGLDLETDLGKRLTSFGASATVHQRNAMETERVVILRRRER